MRIATSLLTLTAAFAMATAPPVVGQRADVPRVVFIGIDGMGAENVWRETYKGVPAPAIPNIDRLRDAGAYSLRASIDPMNFSGPNWMGMLAGADSSEHGVDSNDCTRGAALPTIYDVLHEAFPERQLAIVHEWTVIGCYHEPTSVTARIRTANERETADWAVTLLSDERVMFAFVYFGRLDGAGHDHGGNSREYVQQLESIDREIGRVLGAVAASPLSASTYVILTADHGHLPDGGGHASAEAPVPFIVTGPGAVAGEFDADVRNYQVAPLVTHLFGLAPSSAWSAPLAPFDRLVVR